MKKIFERIASVLVLNSILMIEAVNGEKFVELYSLGLQYLNSTINLAWTLYPNNIHLPGHIGSALNCNANFDGSVTETDSYALFKNLSVPRLSTRPLCPESDFFAYFLYEISNGTQAETKIDALAMCLQNQSFTKYFCSLQQSREAGYVYDVITIVAGVAGSVIIFSGMMLCVLRPCSRNKSSSKENAPAISNITTTANESLALLPKTNNGNQTDNNTSAVEAGMFARGFHRVKAAFQSFRTPSVLSANIDSDTRTDAKNNDNSSVAYAQL